MAADSLKRLLGRLVGPAYFPAVLTASTHTATAVLLPLYVLQQGYSPSMAALVWAMSGLGQTLGNIPAGIVISRFGDKTGLLLGGVFYALAYCLIALTASPLMYGVGALVAGCGLAMGMIARQSYIADMVPVAMRGRSISILGGCMRAGSFIGPASASALAAVVGFEATFWGLLLVIGVMVAVVFFTARSPRRPPDRTPNTPRALLGVLVEHRRVFATAAVPMLCLQFMRGSRVVLLPLVGAQMGLSVAEIGAIVSLGAMFDAAMFIPAGILMDKFGRKYAAIPALAFFAIGLALLGWMESYGALLAVVILMSLGNGLSAGLVLVLGSDHAPEQGRGRFLAVWKLVADSGQAAAPLSISVLLTVTGLAVSGSLVALGGLAGLYIFATRARETLVRPAAGNRSPEP